MPLQLQYYPENQILLQPTKKVENWEFGGPFLPNLFVQMKELMLANEGIGLAAPQIGMDICMFIAKDNKGQIKPYINAEIIEYSPRTSYHIEACLSIPGVAAEIKRPTEILFQYQDVEGNWHLQEADKMFARIVQHEQNHTSGILFPELLFEQRYGNKMKVKAFPSYIDKWRLDSDVLFDMGKVAEI